MKKTTIAKALLAALLLSPLALRGQSDPTLMEVGGEKITRSQFLQEFENNVGSRLRPGTTDAERRQALEEYVDLYATFRAKMLDARSMGLDTAAGLRAELGKYRAELAAPYLIDSTALEQLLHQAYERNRHSLCAAHILVHVSPDASAADTLEAYNRALALRSRVVGGEDFYAVAAEEVTRRNPEARLRPNEGYLGYFTAFDMVHPFEDAAYAMQVGDISMPVRTRFGYHIIKLLDRVPLHGKLDMAHIWVAARDSVRTDSRIKALYAQIENGTPFEDVARYSDDRTTRDNGGYMPDATLNNLPQEYVDKLRDMKPGDVSKPFYTQYGWHIIKLIRCDTLASYENMKPYYKQRLVRDKRGDVSRKAFAATCRTRYGVVDYTQVPATQPAKKKGARKVAPAMQASLAEVASLLPDSVQRGKWTGQLQHPLTDTRTLVAFGERSYNADDLVRFIAKNQSFSPDIFDSNYYVRQMYERFIDSVVVDYADSRLEVEHPEFAELIEDYRRGLMIFDYNDKMIWTKAIEDSVGFADYYRRASAGKRMDNPDDSVFFWNLRARVVVVDLADSTLLKRAKMQKLLEKARVKGVGSSGMKEFLTEAIGKKAGGREVVKVDVDLVEQRRQQLLADGQWQPGVYVTPQGKGFRALVVEEVLPRALKSQAEARGYYLNEYQNEVERQLNASLYNKYNVKIDRDVVKTLVD